MDLNLTAAHFAGFGLDSRLIQAIEDLKYNKPTTIQAAFIPLALRGKDILARAETGTGKTAAYALPIIQRIISQKKVLDVPAVRAVILVPTRDLCTQTQSMVTSLLQHLKKDITCVNMASQQKASERTPLLKTKPDIVISTASLLFPQLASMNVDLSQLLAFVVDEADLVLSECDQLASIKQYLPPGCQTMMLSATLTTQVMLLKNKVMSAPFVIKIEAEQDQPLRVGQYFVQCRDTEKYMTLLGMLTVGDVEGKSIIFMNSVFNATKLAIFLDTFKVPAAVLSSAVPENSRNHIVRQFNDGVFQHLIATDESMKLDDVARRKADLESGASSSKANGEEGETKKRTRSRSALSKYPNEPKRRKLQDRIEKIHAQAQKQGEYGVHRGIDFKAVDWVINFDMCKDASIYTHRIGRTGRAQQEGNALSFFTTKEQDGLLQYVQQDQKLKGREMVPHPHQAAHWEKLRVRVEDVLDRITPAVIDKARVQLLAKEVVNSEKLKNHWKDNPSDLEALSHIAREKPAQLSQASKYLHFMPSYLGLTKKGADQPTKGGRPGAKAKATQRTAQAKVAQPQRTKVNPFSLRAFEKAKKAEKGMSDLDLAVLDPEALRRRRKMHEMMSKKKILDKAMTKKEKALKAAEDREKKNAKKEKKQQKQQAKIKAKKMRVMRQRKQAARLSKQT